jgi:nicotinamide-nucleotide amidase
MNAEIITIGTEILIGQIIDTNSAWIGEQLNSIGIQVNRITSISDKKDHIISSLDKAFQDNDIIIMTGGLGPTNDDITKKVLTEYFNTELVLNEECLTNVKEIFQRFNREVSEVNLLQSHVPKACIPIINKAGTAPGMWFEKEGKILVSTAGVPFEMKWLMTNEILPRLKEKFELPHILHHTTLTTGEGESTIAERLIDFEVNLPMHFDIAYLPSPGRVRIRLSGQSTSFKQLELEMSELISSLELLLEDLIYGYGKEDLSEVIGGLLMSNNQTVSVAESCTGGAISISFVANSGSSDYYKGGVVSYWEEVKSNVLNVSPDIIKQFGVVSEEVAIAMAKGVKSTLNSSCSISTTGIAGPDGGTLDNPVGKVCVATVVGKETVSNTYYFGGSRSKVIERAKYAALNQLRLQLLSIRK